MTNDAFNDPNRHFLCAEYSITEERAKEIFSLYPWAEAIMLPHGYICRNNPGLVIE